MDIELTDFQWQVLEVVASRQGQWMPSRDVAKAVKVSLLSGTVGALVALLMKGMLLQNDGMTWMFCVTQNGIRALRERKLYIEQVCKPPDADVFAVGDVVLMPKNVHSKDALKVMGTPNKYAKVIYIEADGGLRMVDVRGKQHTFGPQWVTKVTDVEMVFEGGRWSVRGLSADPIETKPDYADLPIKKKLWG